MEWFWFRSSASARPKAYEEFCELPGAAQAVLDLTLIRLIENRSRSADVLHICDGLYELRCRHLNNQYRIIFMRWGPHYVGLVSFLKNQRKLPSRELDRAETRAKKWRTEFGRKPESSGDSPNCQPPNR